MTVGETNQSRSAADLIKRLRAKKQKGNRFDSLEYEAADHIEQLVKERDDYAHKLMASNNTYTEMHLEIERLSDKLTKAVEALRLISQMHGYTTRQLSDIARAVLAELEGK